MAVIGIHHIAVTVQEISRAKEFYESIIGLEQIERLTEKTSRHGGAWFRLGSVELHLQERPEKTAKTDQHFALILDNMDEVLERAKNSKVKIEPAALLPGFSRRCFLYDLDGNRIELLQK